MSNHWNAACRFALPAAMWAIVALGAGCPELPSGWEQPRDVAVDGEVFVPLSVVRLDDAIGVPEGGDRVMVRGAGLAPGARVFFDDIPGDSPLTLDGERLNVTTPPHAPGLVDVRVELPDGQSFTLADGFLYESGLRMLDITPKEGSTDGGTPVVVTGRAFTRSTRILVGGQALLDQRFIDATTIEGTTAPRVAERAGRVEVTAFNGLEQAVLPDVFRFTAPLRVDGLDPVVGPWNGGVPLVVRGQGLGVDCVVRLGDQPSETLDFDRLGGFLTVRTPAGPPGEAVDVTVRCAEAEIVLPAAYFYRATAPGQGPLRLQHVYPASGPRRGGNIVALVLDGMTAAEPSVMFGGKAGRILETRFDSRVVQVEAPAGEGSVAIVVTQDGRSSNGMDYNYAADLSIDGFEPAFGPTSGGNEIILRGSGLTRDHRVLFGGRDGDVRAAPTGALRVVVPSGAPGKVDVRVIAPSGDSVVASGGYEYRATRTAVSGFFPPTGAQAGDRIVRVYGEGFATSPPRVRFDGVAVDGVDVLDDGLAVVRTPRGTPGRVHVDAAGERFAMAFSYFDPTRPAGGVGAGRIDEALNVTVIDRVTRLPVPDAFVILWDDLDTPYQGLTDDRGQVTFSDMLFGPPQMVTASRDDYTTASVVEFDGRDVTLVLFPLTASPPGGGGGGGGPQPRDDTVISGRVSGMDKYIVTPPGSCEARLGTAPGTLCQPCASDDECSGDGARCTPLGDEGARCTVGRRTDIDCPENFRCAGVSSASGPAVQCVPDGGFRTARCTLTQRDVFDSNSPFGDDVDDAFNYSIQAPPGEYAVVCLGGVRDRVSWQFTPLVMGVRRNVFGVPGQAVTGQDVPLDIPLTLDLRVRLDGAPTGDLRTVRHAADIFLALGAEGVFRFPQKADGLDVNLFQLKRFPAAFEDSLYNATFTAFGRAVADVPDDQQTGEGSFVVHDGIAHVFGQALFEDRVLDDGTFFPQRIGSATPLSAMLAFDGAPGWLWAPGAKGQVAVFDGTIWGVQQAPTTATLHGVWASEPRVAWAVGAEGTVMRWDGLRWARVALPRELARVDVTWWGIVEAAPEVLVLWGDRGVWRWQLAGEPGPNGVATRLDGDLNAGTIVAMARAPSGALWAAGLGGVLRRFGAAGGVEVFDVPGADLFAVQPIAEDLAWAAGADGRMLRWDGLGWFELLPVGRRDLRALAFDGSERGFAVGDAGEIWRWDGAAWRRHGGIEHQDLRGVGISGARAFFGGLPTMVVGPFMQLPRSLNPGDDGRLNGLTLRWQVPFGVDPSFSWIGLNMAQGFTFWDIMAAGHRNVVPLADLTAAWGLRPLWPGEHFVQVVRAFVPGFDMGAWDGSLFSVYRWRSWSVTAFPLSIPQLEGR